jgi:hypothetical protein
MRSASAGATSDPATRPTTPGSIPQAGDERRCAGHELEVLADEEVRARDEEDHDAHRGDCDRERRPPEEAHVHERVLERSLAADEHHSGNGADNE